MKGGTLAIPRLLGIPIRESKIFRTALQASELENLWHALDQSAAISVSDLEGNITFVNEPFLRASKYTRAEILGKNHRILNSGHHPPEFFGDLWSTISAGRIWRGVVRDKAKDGSLFWMDTTIIPFIGADGFPYQYMAIRHDVTREKAAEEALEEDRSSRGYLERLAALGELQASIAHEVRNPLASVLLQAQMLKLSAQRGIVRPEAVLKATERMEQALGRADKVISGLQTLSRNAEADPFENARAGQLIKDTVEFCRPSLARMGIEVKVGTIDETLELYCRPSQIAQVLLNLINNAKDAVERLTDRWINIEAGIADSIFIAVTDSGPGISSELALRIMEPFFSTKGPGKGSGLGLSISRRIMEEHGGALRLDPMHPNTRFLLEFPAINAGA